MMLLQSGLTFGASEHLNGQRHGNDHITQSPAEPIAKTMVGLNGTPATNTAPLQQTHAANDVSRYVEMVQDSLKEGWSVHANKDGRLYYCK